jgi:hypothetical protein
MIIRSSGEPLKLSHGAKGAYLKQMMQDKVIEHKYYIDTHGQGLPEILNWKWPGPRNNSPAPNVAETTSGRPGTTV